MTPWDELYAGHAFKPHPSLWELAEAHVPFEQIGIDNPPERQLVTHLNEGDGVVLLTGAPGRGKSSTLAYVASTAGTHPDSGRDYLPLFVSVAARADDSIDIDRFGREVIFEFLSALWQALPKEERDQLARQLAREVSRQRTPAAFNAKLVPSLPGLRGSLVSR